MKKCHQKAETHNQSAGFFRSIMLSSWVKLTVRWDCKVGKQKNVQKRLFRRYWVLIKLIKQCTGLKSINKSSTLAISTLYLLQREREGPQMRSERCTLQSRTLQLYRIEPCTVCTVQFKMCKVTVTIFLSIQWKCNYGAKCRLFN